VRTAKEKASGKEMHMKYRDGIFATIALALTSLALTGVVYTDAYSQAAQSRSDRRARSD
jgi:hypothetical protein